MPPAHFQTPGRIAPSSRLDDRPVASHPKQLVRRRNEEFANNKQHESFQRINLSEESSSSAISNNRRLSDWPGGGGEMKDIPKRPDNDDNKSALLKTKHPPEEEEKKKRTLVVYSGPTSLDPTSGKNGVYLQNFDYFIQHGIECHGLGGVESSDHRNHPSQRQFHDNNIQYVIVLTRDVADRYTAADGLITLKQAECQLAQQKQQQQQGLSNNNKNRNNNEPLIRVLTREDKCYDMQSLLTVLRTYDVPHLYDHMVYMNCGLAGPKFGPGSPSQWQGLSSWTELYTSLLSDKIQMVGHTINTHFNTVYSPHIQSFLFAVNTEMIDIWLQTGVIYECGIDNEDFKDDLLRMALVWRYEVGISRVLLQRGYSIASAFLHQNGRIGDPLVIDANSTFGRNYTSDDVIHSDIFTEDGLRRLTESSLSEYQDRRKYAILPWECYVFFKVSRLIPHDIQNLMQYENLGPLQLVPNDARHSTLFSWRLKAGISLIGEGLRLVGISSANNSGRYERLKCHGRICQFEKATEGFGVVMMVLVVLWYFATLKFVERRLNLHRINEMRRKWK